MSALSRATGLRLQLVLAVCGLMGLVLVPLFFALASLTRVAMQRQAVEAAEGLGRAVATRVALLPAPTPEALAPLVRGTAVTRVCSKGACAGAREPRDVEVVVEDTRVSVHVDDANGRAAPLVRLYAGYTTAFALALAFLVYAALTRLIIRPIEALARATDRVASGARKLDMPREGASELVALSESVAAMTARLIADEEALRKKVVELTEAQAQIVRSERMASVGRLAAGMAHEIGNPITALIGMEDLMLEGDVPPSEQRDYLTRMRKETERIHRILRDLLDFARPEMAQEPTRPARANVLAVMRDVEALLRPQKQFREIRVVVDAAEALDVPLPPERLTQVLLNLALNAGDAMSHGPSGATLTMRATRAQQKTRIEVEDTGPGVAASVRDRLFLPFVTTKEVGQGTGLGLAVCRGIVEAAGGRIGLDEGTTAGARFFIEV